LESNQQIPGVSKLYQEQSSAYSNSRRTKNCGNSSSTYNYIRKAS